MHGKCTVHEFLDNLGNIREKRGKVMQKVNIVLKIGDENSDKNKQDFSGVFVRRVKNV